MSLVVIAAVQWDGQNYPEVSEFVGGSLDAAWSVGGYCFINTLEGRRHVAPGDWIIAEALEHVQLGATS